MLYCPHQCRVNEVSGIKWLQWLTIHRHYQHQGCYPSPPHATAASDFSFQALSDIKSCSVITSLHSEFVSHLIAFLCAKDIRIYHKVQKKKNGEVPSLFYNISLSVNIGEYTIPSQVYMCMTLCVYMYRKPSCLLHNKILSEPLVTTKKAQGDL